MTEQQPRRRRRRRRHANWGVLLWLTIVWVFLWGELSLANVVVGLLVGLVITSVMPLPQTPFNGRFRPWGTILLIAHFLKDVVLASIEVSKLAMRREPPTGAVIRVRLRSHNDVYLTMVAGMTTLVPGSVVVEAHRITGTLYHHILDVEMQGGLEAAHQSVLDQEERILRAFGTREELLDAGLVPGSTPRAGKLTTPAGARAQTEADARGEAR